MQDNKVTGLEIFYFAFSSIQITKATLELGM